MGVVTSASPELLMRMFAVALCLALFVGPGRVTLIASPTLDSSGFRATVQPAPAPSIKAHPASDAWKILVKTVRFSFLIFLPGFALAALAARRGVHGTLKLGLIVLAGVALPGYLICAVFFFSARTGHWLSTLLPLLSAMLLAASLWKCDLRRTRRILPLLTPLALTFAAALGILALGFQNGGLTDPFHTSRNRFALALPADNQLPWILEEGLRKGVVPKPFFGDWLSSDRPPLQAGIMLALESYMKVRRELCYGISGAILQELWVFALWLLLTALRCSRASTSLVLLTTYTAGTSLVNGFHVWPKLLAAAYMLAFALPLMAARARPAARSWLNYILLAFLLACSLLAHAGPAFSLLALVPVLLISFRLYRLSLLKPTAIVLGLALLFYAPWIAYQKYIDPPGDRLLKYHLAGVEQPVAAPAPIVILEAYRHQSWRQWTHAKKANFLALYTHGVSYLLQAAAVNTPEGRYEIRHLEFFFLVPSVGFVLVGLLAYLLPASKLHYPKERAAASRLLAWAVATTGAFILLMFKADSTVLHQGTYVLVFMAMAGSILAFWSAWPRLTVCVCAAEILFHLLAYELPVSPARLIGISGPTNYWLFALHLLSLTAFGLILALGASLPLPRNRRILQLVSRRWQSAIYSVPYIGVIQ